MSEIVIRGIEFPKEGTLALLITSNGEVYRIPRKYDYIATVTITESKAIELPPHGDLISKQETVTKLTKAMCEDCHFFDDCNWCSMEEYRRIVANAPTVLEASK